MLSKLRRRDWILLSLLLLLNLFTLPTSGVWSLPPPKNLLVNSNLSLSSLVHPSIPVVINPFNQNLTTADYILVDTESNTILLSSQPHQKIYPASVTKLATALTALNIYPLDEIITVKEAYSEGKVMELKPGEKITVRSLVSALLVYSANDAAFNLAFHHSGGVPGFITEMNAIAKKYNLSDTHFTNFDGIHNDNHYSSVYDLAQLGRLAIKNNIIRDVVKNKELVVTDVDKTYSHHLVSTNELLGVIPEIEGLKTGWTPEAGGCFVALININGHYLISVVAQSVDRFQDTQQIINWAKTSLTWRTYQ